MPLITAKYVTLQVLSLILLAGLLCAGCEGTAITGGQVGWSCTTRKCLVQARSAESRMPAEQAMARSDERALVSEPPDDSTPLGG